MLWTIIKKENIIKHIIKITVFIIPVLNNEKLWNIFFFEILYPAMKYGKNIIVLFKARILLRQSQYPSKRDIIILIININGTLLRYLIVILQ